MSEILKHFPGIPRPVQKDILVQLEENWEDYDVFVINAPVGSGKSRVAMAVAEWQRSVDIITPTNMLVQQYMKDYPKYPKLLKEDLYPCCTQAWKEAHEAARARGKKRASRKKRHDCERDLDRSRALVSQRCLMNYYMYQIMNMGKTKRNNAPVLIVDEAHNLIPTIQSLNSSKMWRHKWKWPEDISNYPDLIRWAKRAQDSLPTTAEERKTLKLVVDQCSTRYPTYIFEKAKEWWFKTKKPEFRDVLNIKPVEISRLYSAFKNSQIEKLILMSSTINNKDIESLGLEKRRVLYLDSESAIPARNRPVHFDPVTSVTYQVKQESAKKIAERLLTYYLPKHEGEKGVIHATYEMAKLLKPLLRDSSRFIWHDKYNKTAKYQEFRDSPKEEGKVLVASGLYEGIDLPNDLSRWQVIAKVPWISLADKAVKYKADQDDEWYRWETLKDLIQASGRICRGPNDYGITYIVDKTFQSLYNNSQALIPDWFKQAVHMEEETNG